jgi:hypothetical protein
MSYGSGAVTCSTAPSGLWTIKIKKGLAALGMQLGLRVFETNTHITKANRHHGPARRVVGDTLNDYKTCRQAAAVPLQCNVHPLTTHDALLQCLVT